ncbi:fam-c protein [Plasmodium vinckei brucechwatti]|uniref:Fam-c protein n=1 Tax=Plasmodium vinckei brucechwatti TaxID=119398 RepID=A0A6V7S2K2_PLAVN|nr:fam-c protein [Plasmodium vinckei brucechwatti]
MNKRIYSLVCIALYALLDASIYCSQQKESDARNKSVRGTKEINRSNDEYDKESSGFNIFKSGKKSKRTKENLHSKEPSDPLIDEMIKIFLNNHKDLPMDRLGFEIYIKNLLENDPEQSMFLRKLIGKLIKSPPKHELEYVYKELFSRYANSENEKNNSLSLSNKFKFLMHGTLDE